LNTFIRAISGTQNVKLEVSIEKKTTTFVLNDFKVFSVYLQNMVLVKFLTRSEPRYLTWILLDTGHFLLRWTWVWDSWTLVTTHIAVVIFYLIHQPGIELELSNVRLQFVMLTSVLHYEWHLQFGSNSSILPKFLNCNNFITGTKRCHFLDSCYAILHSTLLSDKYLK